MLKRLRDELSEKTKLIVYLSITVFFFITACLLPLAFAAGGDKPEAYFDRGERAALFLKYDSGSKDIKTQLLGKVSATDSDSCEKRLEEIIGLCRIDNKSGKLITRGSEYIQLSDGENVLRLYHAWIQDEGDWTNWMDVYFDMDTGFVYYLYISSVCLDNPDDYADAIEDGLNAKSVAGLIAENTDSVLRHFSWSGNLEDSAYAVMTRNGDTVCWNINCIYYESTMLDVKFIVA